MILLQIKKKVFRTLIDGDLRRIPKTVGSGISHEKANYFFTMLLQPLNWKLPVTVIHLTKSSDGHFSVNEAEDIRTIFGIINNHPHFQARYFAADGEHGLNDFHQLAFEKYEEAIPEVLNKRMNIQDFITNIKEKCQIFPVLDMVHGEKSGRNRIVNNIIKLGNDVNLITKEQLAKDLSIFKDVLTDRSPITIIYC